MTAISPLARQTPIVVRHDRMTIALHWISAFLVIAQFASAEIWGFLEKGTPPRIALIMTHLAFGMLLAAVIILRICWRITKRGEIPAAVSGLQHLTAQTIHMLLYCLLIAQVLLGFLFGWSSGKPLPFFNLFSLPPLIMVGPEWRHAVAECHNTIAWVIIAVVAVHAAAALMHHYLLKDGVLLRMMPGRR